MIGLNFPADARLAPAFGALLGARWLRVVLLPDVDLTSWIQDAHARSMKVLGVIARESLAGSYNETAILYADRYGELLDAVQAGNEPDHESPSSWTMEPSDLNDLLAAVNMQFAHTTIVGPGLVSGNPHYLDAVDLDLVDAIAVHPYGQRPNENEDWSETPGNHGAVATLLDSYRYHNRPTWVTEVGVMAPQECSLAFQARYCEAMIKALKRRSDVPVVTWFCADDEMVDGFGLYRSGRPKPAAVAFIRATGSTTEEDPVPTFIVGPGVLEQMRLAGDKPATDEIYHPIGAAPGKSQYSETFGESGTRYVYVFATNKTYRFSPTS